MKQLKALVRRFVRSELLPLEKEVQETGKAPSKERRDELRRKARELGLWGLATPKQYGGQGLGELENAIVAEEVGWVVGLRGGVGYIVGDDRAARFISTATDEQREKYFLPAVRGEKESCIALTEPEGGSDVVGAIRTRATRQGENYVLEGSKRFISDADIASFALVYAVTDPGKGARGITCFLVDTDNPGFILDKKFSLTGLDGMGNFDIVLSDCVVPAGNILGEPGGGLSLALRQLSPVRIILAARSVGTMERLLEMSKNYAKERVAFGKPICEQEAIQWMLADMAVDINATRMMTYNVAWEADQGIDIRGKLAMVKLYATQSVYRAADNAMQIFGGIGYTKEFPIEMIWRDARFYRIGDGTDEMMKLIIAREVLRE